MIADSLFFTDTNVLLYGHDQRNAAKRRAAQDWIGLLWERGAGRLSWQVLNEFYANAIGRIGAPARVARRTAEAYSSWNPAGFGLGMLHRAWYWMDKAGVPYWDSLIIAAAETMNCAYLLSEDFQAGREFGDITVVNPFRSTPEEFGLR
jgi:predicted nucleic acid-binding protein